MFENISEKLKGRAQKIKAIGFDVDGVLTDGTVWIDEKGECFKNFNAQDGLGVELARKFDLKVCIISGRDSIQTHIRFGRDKGLDEVHTGIHDKLKCATEILERWGISWDEFAYIGDDLIDVAVMEKAGLCACPPDAHYSVKKHIHYITEKPAGKACAREFVDLILHCQAKIPS